MKYLKPFLFMALTSKDISILKTYLAQGDIEKCLKSLVANTSGENDKENNKTAILYQNQLNSAKKGWSRGLMGTEDYSTQCARLAMAILDFLDEVEQEWIEIPIPVHSEIIIVYFVGFSTPELTSLNVNKEFNEIKSQLRNSRYYSLHDSIIRSLEELNIEIGMRGNDFIVHFACHGEIDGLHLADSEGHSKFENSQTIVKYFTPFQNRIHCIILNACDSYILGDRLSEFIKNVICMTEPVQDESSIFYAKHFYLYLTNNFRRDDNLLFEQSHNFAKNGFGVTNNQAIYIVEYKRKMNI